LPPIPNTSISSLQFQLANCMWQICNNGFNPLSVKNILVIAGGKKSRYPRASIDISGPI
jgi:hypothetical protein